MQDKDINDPAFGVVRVIRWRDGVSETQDDLVIQEARFGLWINGGLLVHMMCLPRDLDALAVGFLISEGILAKPEDLTSINVDEERGRIECAAEINEDALRLRRENWTLGTGCGGGGTGTDPNEPIECRRIDTQARFSIDVLCEAGNDFNRASHLYEKTGGVHSAALYDSDGALVTRADDVGRHNAFDKAIGKALLQGVSVRDKAILTTGRISTDIASKAIRHKIPLVVSRSAPTTRALWLAQRFGITVAGFLRGKRVNIYTCEERIEGIVTGEPAAAEDDGLTSRLRQAVSGGKLSCKAAHQISSEVGVTIAEIGAACERAGIKIGRCQLGCF